MAVQRRQAGLALSGRRLAQSRPALGMPQGSIRLDPGQPAWTVAFQVELAGFVPGLRSSACWLRPRRLLAHHAPRLLARRGVHMPWYKKRRRAESACHRKRRAYASSKIIRRKKYESDKVFNRNDEIYNSS